jgi:hypothetical protein
LQRFDGAAFTSFTTVDGLINDRVHSIARDSQGRMWFGTELGVSEFHQPRPGDVNGDGNTDVDDLLAVLNAWGPCADCPADLTDDDIVNVDDLLAVINGWNACN